MRTVVERHCNDQFWRGELWCGGQLLWWTSYEDTRECVRAKLRDWKRFHAGKG